MIILIDGYNLLYAIGWARRGMSLPEWNAARKRLLHWLAEHQARRSARFEVVLDGQNTKRSAPIEHPSGLLVQVAYGQTADEMIEDRLPTLSGEVVVVSNDQRIKDAARRHRGRSWNCTDFLDWLNQPEANLSPPVNPTPEKPTLSPADEAALLSVFSQPKPRSRR